MQEANGADVAVGRAATPGRRSCPRSASRVPSRRPQMPAGPPAPISRILLALSLTLLALLAATAAGQGLYGPEAPRDTAYLRLINASGQEAVTMTVDGNEWEPLPFAGVTPYRQLAPGEHSLSLFGQDHAFTASPEGFITAVALPERVLLLEDTPLRDISRGLLTLYNLTGAGPLTLRTADGTEVLTDVQVESAESIAISEAEVGLVLYQGGEELEVLEPRLYSRGEAHSLIVLPHDSEPRLIYARAGAEH
jgi:alginate O-acetyltransferase complex protein AlgF